MGSHRSTINDQRSASGFPYGLGPIRRVLLISFRSKPPGSNAPPIHSSIRSCSSCLGYLIADKNSSYPLTPPTSSGGAAFSPATHSGYDQSVLGLAIGVTVM